jgi:hypothetical protein
VPVDGKPELREVKIGRTNDVVIEIIEGASKLKEGDQVILNPRSVMSKELAEIEQQEKAKAEEEAKKKPPSTPKLPDDKPKAPGAPGSPGAPAGSPTLAGGPGTNPLNRAPGAGSGPGGAGPGGSGPGGPGGGFDPSAFFKRMDADGDGKITLAEAPERMQSRFAELDKNGDGAIDLEEFKAGRPPGRGPGGPGGGGPAGGQSSAGGGGAQ